ncbi:MAG: hypothetical protein HWD59_10310 [Coxiellaceae bacterium]|nr:MAG: hypothetical protein HWD59_10310 [Coxiellaceae bacterium]
MIATALNKTKGKLNFLIPAIDKKQQKIINFSKEIHMEILPFINKDVLENDNQL